MTTKKIKDQLEFALNEIKNTLTVEQGELLHEYVSEALKQVKNCSNPNVLELLPNDQEIEQAANKEATRIFDGSDNGSEWYARHHGFTDGVEWLKNQLYISQVVGQREKLIKELVDKKAEQDNKVDLHAYENGMRALSEALNIPLAVQQGEEFYCSYSDDGEYTKCENQCLECAGLEEQVKQ